MLRRLRKFLETNGMRISIPDERNFESEGEVIESGLRRTIKGRDGVMPCTSRFPISRCRFSYRKERQFWQCASGSLRGTGASGECGWAVS
jgi:hypothetical protein